MVVKLIRWPSWPPFHSKKFEVIIVIRRLEGLRLAQSEGENMLGCEIKWRGQKGIALGSLRRSVKRNLTNKVVVGDDGLVEWNEGFQSVCSFSYYKEGVFNPWEVSFTVFNVSFSSLIMILLSFFLSFFYFFYFLVLVFIIIIIIM